MGTELNIMDYEGHVDMGEKTLEENGHCDS